MTASLADKIAEVAQKTGKPSGTPCRVCALPPEWLEGVHGARDQHGTSFPGIARSLKLEGFNVGESSLKNHFQNHR